MSETYAAMFEEAAKKWPEHPALVFPGETITYQELLARARHRAQDLTALGVGHGDTFGIMLPNSPAFVELLLGGALIGAVPVPINIRYKPFEVQHLCRDGQLVALFTTDLIDDLVPLTGVLYDALPGLRTSDATRPLDLEGYPGLRHIVLVGGGSAAGMVSDASLSDASLSEGSLSGSAVDPDHGEGPAPDDPLMIMYTSGTTSMAKGCVLTNRAVTLNCRGTAERFAIPADDRWWDPLPMFHMGSLLLMSAVFSSGACFASMGHFEAGAALDMFGEYRPTVLYPLFPTITLTLMHDPAFAAYDRRDVRVVCNVSPPDIQRQVQAAFDPAILISAYGMTELCGTLAYSCLDDTYSARTTNCGRLLPGWEAAIIDPETGHEVPRGTRGELIAKGESLFAGYFANPAQTAASIDDAGFFHTGDLCSMDDDGYLLFHGRLKDVLKVGGENVSALEVESYLASHPAIKLAQIVGIPDDRLLEVPVAFVELTPGATLSEQETIDFCTGQIARFKIPRHVRFVNEWPMSSTKIQKFRLREQILAELGLPG